MLILKQYLAIYLFMQPYIVCLQLRSMATYVDEQLLICVFLTSKLENSNIKSTY